MGRNYTNNDDRLGDFFRGLATGASYNFHSWFGAGFRQPPAPYGLPKPVGRNSRNEAVIVPQPIRPLTPEERAEWARWSANREIIVKKAPFFQRFSGKVHSYLDADGKLVVNANGDLVEGEVIPRREHLARVEKAYRRIWQALPQTYTAKLEICERMAKLERGYFISPVNRWGLNLTIDRYRTKKTIFGKKKSVKRRIWTVGVKEYDRRLRIFIDNAYLGQFSGKKLMDLPAQEVFECFIRWPRTF